jgi:hypothetical protein
MYTKSVIYILFLLNISQTIKEHEEKSINLRQNWHPKHQYIYILSSNYLNYIKGKRHSQIMQYKLLT